MGCVIWLLSLIGPRVALAFTWIFTGFVDRAYDETWVPIVGFIFLPWTTLVYALAYDGSGVSSLGWFFVVLAVIGDISSYGVASRRRRRRPPPQPTPAPGY
jgi:hypothetical protein